MKSRKTQTRAKAATAVVEKPAVAAKKPRAPKRQSKKSVELVAQTDLARASQDANQDLTRTHKAFGLFPNALLFFGYGESKQENERVITTEEKNVQTGEIITRQMKIYTNSFKGLPRGRDPQVLIALLHLTLQKPGSNSLWFRKADLIKTLGWSDTPDNRQDIDEAISRYFEAAYSGLDVRSNGGGSKTKEKFSRIITDYINIDERKVRRLDNERLFSKVVFNEEIINEIRSADLSLYLNLRIIQSLQNSPTALRLYEVVNYLTSPVSLNFSIDIKELAYNRLGISTSKKTPGQCLQAIKPAAEKLLGIGYLRSFDYDQETRLVGGEVNPVMVSPSPEKLAPLPSADEKRKRIIELFVALESYPNPTATIINSLPEDLLDDAEIIAEIIAREKNENLFGRTFRYGGRALKQLKNLQATGEISQSLLEQVHQDATSNDAEQAVETAVLLGDRFDAQSAKLNGARGANKAAEPAQTQLPLPISFAGISAISGEAEDLWRKCFAALETRLPAQTIGNWFSEQNLTPLAVEDKTLVLQVASEDCLSWIGQMYAKTLQDAIDEATKTGGAWKIKFVL